MHVALYRQVWGAPHQAPGNEGVVQRDDQQGNDVENKEGGHGVDLRVQIPSVGVRRAGSEAFIGGGEVESVEVREDGLRDRKDQGEEPDESRPQDNAAGGGWCLDVQWLHYGLVPEERKKER